MAQTTVLTNAGLAIVTNLVTGLGGTVPKYLAWGTGAGTATVDRTTLFTEVQSRVTSTDITRQQTAVANDTIQIKGTMTCDVTAKTITNAGLFDASSVGNLFAMASFDGVSMTQNDYITFTYKVQCKMTS